MILGLPLVISTEVISVMGEERPIRVLVVDDEPAIAVSLAEFLEDFGYTVVYVGSAEAALEESAKSVFDVAIIDLRLPYMSGEALILKLHSAYSYMRFIIHTGSVSFSLSEELEKIGVTLDQVFIKPQSSLNRFIGAIEELVNGPK